MLVRPIMGGALLCFVLACAIGAGYANSAVLSRPDATHQVYDSQRYTQSTNAKQRCQPKAVYAFREFKSLAGLVLWKYYLQVKWCWRNGKITWYKRHSWAVINSVTPYVEWRPWEFKGHTDSGVEGDKFSKTAHSQGSFQVCLAGDLLPITCNNQNPTVFITVNGDGSWRGWTRG